MVKNGFLVNMHEIMHFSTYKENKKGQFKFKLFSLLCVSSFSIYVGCTCTNRNHNTRTNHKCMPQYVIKLFNLHKQVHLKKYIQYTNFSPFQTK